MGWTNPDDAVEKLGNGCGVHGQARSSSTAQNAVGGRVEKGQKRTLEEKRDKYTGTGTSEAKEAKDRKNEKGSLKAESWSRTSTSWQPNEWDPVRGVKRETWSSNLNSHESWSGASSSLQPKNWDPARTGKGEKRCLDLDSDDLCRTGCVQKKAESQGASNTETWSRGSSSWQTSR